jgi:type IV secretory pathway TrbD component
MTFEKRHSHKIKAVLEPCIILFLGGLVVLICAAKFWLLGICAALLWVIAVEITVRRARQVSRKVTINRHARHF